MTEAISLVGVKATWTIPFSRQWWEDDESINRMSLVQPGFPDLASQAREEIEPFFDDRDGVRLANVQCGWDSWVVCAWVDREHLSSEFLEDITQDLEKLFDH